LFLSIYFYNRWILRKMTISNVEYSLAKTFQIRENCSIMECLMFAGVSAGLVTAIGFGFFCYYKWAPEEWLLSRHLAIALFDIFIILPFLYGTCGKHGFRIPEAPPIYKKSALKSAHYIQPGSVATTRSYFNQLDAS
ncbi:hypothetical protein PRIPAC_76273, partial [Pristionchus pacificus]|uniref:Uncharacterized protein n=1 Tax=Pristionchus pacificus TaxID=54126 RepID=A0A2A6B575_PRIPA